jgi:hypothetical protein
VPCHCRSEYLNRFVPAPSPQVPSCGSTLAERCAGRLLMLWVRHASLLRPLDQTGRLQLAKDLAEMTLVVGQGLFPLEATGPAHRWVTVEHLCRGLSSRAADVILGPPGLCC